MSRTCRSPIQEPTRTKLLPLVPTIAMERAGSSTTYTITITSSSPSQGGGRGISASPDAAAMFARVLSPDPSRTAKPSASTCHRSFLIDTKLIP